MNRPLVAALTLVLALAPGRLSADASRSTSDTLPGGARWTAEIPAKWNGTLLLWSRGYSFRLDAPEAAPGNLKAILLDAGYALAGSDYGSAGWALEQAVPAQIETLDAFAARYGKPERVIGWGYSMGGLVTAALAEQRPARIHGGAAFCSSIGGAVGMMNMGLDGAYAFRTLVAPNSDIELVGVVDDMANAQRVRALLAQAMTSPAGRARVALAAVLAGIPGWTKPGTPAPDPTDYERQVDQIAEVFPQGVFLPRVDQERRAGGPFSWNKGIDYRQQLRISGRRRMVEALYERAGLDLNADLRRLAAGSRIEAKPSAVAYMMRNYTPNGRPRVPLVAIQAIGDGITSPSLQQGYAAAAKGDVKSLWVAQAGHCNFEPQVVTAGIGYLDKRIRTGRWPARPAMLVEQRVPRLLRPCFAQGRCR